MVAQKKARRLAGDLRRADYSRQRSGRGWAGQMIHETP